MAAIWGELKRRNVVRVAVAYAIVSWLLLQLTDVLMPLLGLPEWVDRLVFLLLVIGFPLALIFAWAFELTPEGLKKEKDVDRSESNTPITGRKLDFIIIAALVLALGYFALDKFVLDPSRDAELVQTTTDSITQQAIGTADNSIAVLPFRNRSAVAEDVYFVDGIHDDILTQLAKLSFFGKVISRTSMEQYRETNKPMPQIGQELGVATILEGGVQRAGDRVRINVQLIQAATDKHLWAETYDRQLTASNIFSIQSEIASAIADALQASLTPRERERIDRVPTENMAALESYFLGRQLFYRRGSALDGAIAALRTAVDRDPAFAEAWTFLAAAALVTWGYDTSISDENALALAKKASRRAIELNPNLGLALAVRANMAVGRRDWNEAFDLYHRALNVDSNDSTIRMWFGQFTFLYGYLSEALIHLERAYELDPLVGINNGALGIAYLASGQDALARPRLAKAEELGWTDHVATNFVYLMHTGSPQSSIAYLERTYEDTDDPIVLRGRQLLAEAVRKRDAASVDALEPHIDAMSLAGGWGLDLFLVFELKDRFFERLSRLVADNFHWEYAMRVVWLPGNRDYVEDRRFLEIMIDGGVVTLWEQRGYPDGCIRVGDAAGDRLDCAERYR